MMTDEEYLITGGNRCPFCNSLNYELYTIEGEEQFQSDSNEAWQRIVCLDCGKKWDDVYTLNGFVEVKE